jgi:hypothetical protein
MDLGFRVWVSVAKGGSGFLVRWPWWIELVFVVLIWDLWFWIELGGHGFFAAKFVLQSLFVNSMVAGVMNFGFFLFDCGYGLKVCA